MEIVLAYEPRRTSVEGIEWLLNAGEGVSTIVIVVIQETYGDAGPSPVLVLNHSPDGSPIEIFPDGDRPFAARSEEIGVPYANGIEVLTTKTIKGNLWRKRPDVLCHDLDVDCIIADRDHLDSGITQMITLPE